MQKLSVSKRPGTIGANITTRTEKHGDENKPALTIKVKGILMTKSDLGRFYEDENIHDHLYTHERSSIIEPRCLNTVLTIGAKFKGAKVTILPQNAKEAIELKPATVDGIVLELQPGGHTLMSCSIKAAEPDDAAVNTGSLINQKCAISITGGKLAQKEDEDEDDGEQPELGLEGGGPADDDGDGSSEAEDEGEAGGGSPEESGISRQIRGSEAKKARKARKKNVH
jgi:hypothetical protein